MMTRTKASLTLAVALIAAAAPVARTSDVVEIRLRSHYYAEPATVRVTVAVEPDAENRVLLIEADSEQFFRASEVALSGNEEKRLHELEFKNLPAGSYTLRAEVRSGVAVRGQASQALVVTSMGGL